MRPAAFLARDRRRSVVDGRPLPEIVEGSALFADISGFTPLTESLALEFGPHRGAEELSIHLVTVFTAVIERVHSFGGEVLNFSGDAITCWLDGDDGHRAAACGLAIQQAMDDVGRITTASGNEVVLRIKVAVAVGTAHRFAVGDPAVQCIEVLAGKPIDDLAVAEQLASPTEIVLAASAAQRLAADTTLADPTTGGDETGARLLVALADPPAPSDEEPDRDPPDEVVRPWILPAVYERLQAGRGDFLAELRPVFAMFMRFGGFDIDDDPDAVAKINTFIRASQAIIRRFDGNVVQVTHGDKGAYLYAVFGAPNAHDDDGMRAAAAALELLELEDATDACDLQIGLTYGRLYSGTYGHPDRMAFGCLGDTTNLAARLMMKAPPRSIFATEEVRTAVRGNFEWAFVGDLTVKGKAKPVPTVELRGVGEAAGARSAVDLPIVGRGRELAILARARDDVIDGRRRIVALVGEGGRGKSRLLAELVDDLDEAGVAVVQGAADAYGQNRSYLIWRTAARDLLGVQRGAPRADQIAAVERSLEAVTPGAAERAPLLGPVIGIDIDDNELTAPFDAKLRKASLEALLVDVVRARASEAPLAVVLDDAHWIDGLSIDLLDALVRATADVSVLFVVAARPAHAPDEFGLDRHDGYDRIELDVLTDDDARALATTKVVDLWGPGTDAAPPVVAFAVERAQGNPFFLESIFEWIWSRHLDPSDAAIVRGLDLPDNLHSLVLSRVDALDEAPRRTLKVASVVGQTFVPPALHGVYPALGSVDAIDDQLTVLDVAELVGRDREAASWHFRHVLTREVAYESLPFGLRADLHGRAGEYLETLGSTDLDLLAHHFWHSHEATKKVEYLDRAGTAAQARYANADAITYLERLAGLLAGGQRADALLRLAKVLSLTGDWVTGRQRADEAKAISLEHDDVVSAAWCDVTLAELDRKQGHYDEAAERLDHARDEFARAGVDDGIAQVLHLTGTLAAQQGEYDTARRAYEESIAVREQLDDHAGIAAAYSNLGVVAEYSGEYEAALEFHRRALDIRTDLGDRWAIAVSHTNIGMIAVHEERFVDAEASFREAMRLNLEVGDVWMVAICHNNLGNALRGIGAYDEARHEYAAAALTYRDYDDHWALAFLLEDVAALAADVGASDAAFELLGAADRERADLGSPRAPALETALTEKLVAASSLEPAARDEARGRGGRLDTEQAVTALLAVCATESSPGV